jgi:hypothetical protein
LGHANAAVLPLDWRATAAEFKATIARYQEAAGDLVDLGPARDATAAFGERVDRFYAALGRGEVEERSANEVLQRLARILVPLNFTTTPRFRHDPAFTCPPLPTLAIAAEIKEHPKETLGFARTQFMRGQNRYVAAMRAAGRLVEDAL